MQHEGDEFLKQSEGNHGQPPYDKGDPVVDKEYDQQSTEEVIVHKRQVESNMPVGDVSNSSSSGQEVPSTSTTETISGERNVPKKNDRITFKLHEDSEWCDGIVLSPAGKQTGNNRFCVNVQTDEDASPLCVDLKKVHSWQTAVEVEHSNVTLIPLNHHSNEQCQEAKLKELKAFEDFGVYENTKDTGQYKISTKWVLTEKLIDGKMGVKARLVARGFEDNSPVESDSPTCTQDSFRLFLAIAVSKNWSIECTDIKSAFLQGRELYREVFIEPPGEVKQPGVIWRLKNCMYGLQDAPRMRYLNVADVLKEIGCKQIGLDLSLFVYVQENVLKGVILVHVDDFLHIGTPLFYKNVINKLRDAFKVGAVGKTVFAYIGLELKQGLGCIQLSQSKYVNSLAASSLSVERKLNKDQPLNKEEHSLYRRFVGQLNWVSRHTRPDIVFDVMELSMRLTSPCVHDYCRAVKTLKKLQNSEVGVVFPDIGSFDEWRLLVLSDAAFANLSDGVSSAGGYLILLVGIENRCLPVCWKANKIKRKVNSTLAAECLALKEAIDHCLLIRNLLKDMLGSCFELPIAAWTDNRNTFISIKTTTQVDDKRLRIDIACIKDSIMNDHVTVHWCPGNEMLANCLTKRGCSADDLLYLITLGRFNEHFKDCSYVLQSLK